MPKRPSKRKGPVKTSEVPSPPKRSKNEGDETHFDDILSQIATQSQSESLWKPKNLKSSSSEVHEDLEDFSVEPGLMSDSSSSSEDEESLDKNSKANDADNDKVIEILIKQPSGKDIQDKNKQSKKRRLALQREAKRIDVLIHRVRFIASVSHLLFVGRKIRESEILLALSLSVFPPAHSKVTPTPAGLASFVKWYSSAVSIFPMSSTELLTSRLQAAFPKLEFGSQLDSILGFYSLVLSVGWNVRLLYAPTEDKKNNKEDRHWCEVWTNDQQWTIVDPVSGRSGSIAREIEKRLSPFWYVLALCPRGFLKDVTPKYVQNYVTSTSKKRKPHEEWVQHTLRPYLSKCNASSKEDKELDKLVNDAPIPSTLSAMKGHPLYVTPKLLGKLEVIHPSSVKPVGTFRQKEPVYKRMHVHKLRSLISWQKDGMDVRKGERPRLTEKDKTFWGSWQVERFIPPTAKDGKVPKNEFGNVEVYKPWMVPKGAVHIPISGISRLAKKLDIDFAPAVIGWDYHMKGSHPVVDGIIVCSEFQDVLLDAWNNDEEVKSTKYYEKRQLRILNNWRKLTKGLILRERFKMKYKT